MAFSDWLLADLRLPKGIFSRPETEHAWWRVMFLTGVDYFSTLGYQPGIAFLAAGFLSPLATLILILVTLFGALPVYCHVAKASPLGQGSIGMLEKLFPEWSGKTFVLILLGFATTDFVITMTLSAADAAAHVTHNPLTPEWMRSQVAVYLAANLAITAAGIREVLRHPELPTSWQAALFTQHGNPLATLGIGLVLLPKLALGLSGLETGVAVQRTPWWPTP